MSTRSAVCEPYGDGYRGRYVHSDGSPTGVGWTLLQLVARDGLENVRQTLIHDHAGWSILRPHAVKITRKMIADAKRAARAAGLDWRFGGAVHDYTSPEYQAWYWDRMCDDGRYINVPGYGVAYSTTQIELWGEPYQQASEDDWITPDIDDDTEWRYVLANDSLKVFSGFGAWPKMVGTIPYDLGFEQVEVLQSRWQQRCRHDTMAS